MEVVPSYRRTDNYAYSTLFSLYAWRQLSLPLYFTTTQNTHIAGTPSIVNDLVLDVEWQYFPITYSAWQIHAECHVLSDGGCKHKTSYSLSIPHSTEVYHKNPSFSNWFTTMESLSTDIHFSLLIDFFVVFIIYFQMFLSPMEPMYLVLKTRQIK